MANQSIGPSALTRQWPRQFLQNGSKSELEKTVENRTRDLRYLSSHLMRVQDDERRRIARELHDSLGQYLTATKIQLDALDYHVPAEHHEVLAAAKEYVERSLSETRTLSMACVTSAFS